MDDPPGRSPVESSIPVDSEAAPPAFWSPWSTVGWGVLIAVVFVLVQATAVAVWYAIHLPPGTAAVDGDLVAVGTLSSAVVCGSLVVFLTALRRGSRPLASLALTPPSARSLGGWLVLTAGLLAASDLLTALLGKPIVPQFMTDVLRTTSVELLLLAAIIVAAPVFEELLFRGFLLEGLRRGRLGAAGATAVTALLWASIHVQYGWYEISTIFFFGLVLGVARIRSGSLWVPIAMHMMANVVATVEAMIAV